MSEIAVRHAAPVPAARWAPLDRLVHAAESRLTMGLSPVGQAMAGLNWAAHLANAPFRRLDLATLALQNWQRLGATLAGQTVITPLPGDHRFDDPAWRTAPFNTWHQAFLLTEAWWAEATGADDGTQAADRRIVGFTARQLLDMLAPSNLPWMNPEILRATVTSGGANLVQGYSNLLADLTAAMTGHPAGDAAQPVLGQDIAATPGEVIFCNDLIELIQYTPTTPRVNREPVLIVPAWIMKYYILDLSAQNSLVRWLLAQGHSVFMISWRNPGPEMRNVALDDYRVRGVMAAMDAVSDITGGARIHATGYCLGGTLLAIAAAAMARDADQRLASMTLFCAQTDFTEAGELQLFTTEDQLAFLRDIMSVHGTLDSKQMAGAFQALRSNALVWSHAIRTYWLGERDQPNDLMAWNADGTRMPARMHDEYLRELFLDNDLAEGRLDAGGSPVSVADINVPIFVVGTETDHIAPWHSVYKIHLLNPGDITFVLTSGGHNAGVVSEPGHPHRHFRQHQRTPGQPYAAPEAWQRAAELHEGSWWPAWSAWLHAHGSAQILPPPTGSAHYAPLVKAPGRYVLER